MRRKQRILLSVILPIILVAAFFSGYFFSVIRLMSWDVFTSKPIKNGLNSKMQYILMQTR